MALIKVFGRCKRHDIINVVPLFEPTLCKNSLFACKCDRHDNFLMILNVNRSNELNFSEVHGDMNRSGSLIKLTLAHSLCMRQTAVHSSMNIGKMKSMS